MQSAEALSGGFRILERSQSMKKELERLQYENKCMKEALEAIANIKESDVESAPEVAKYPEMLGMCQGIAVATLKQVNEAH